MLADIVRETPLDRAPAPSDKEYDGTTRAGLLRELLDKSETPPMTLTQRLRKKLRLP